MGNRVFPIPRWTLFRCRAWMPPLELVVNEVEPSERFLFTVVTVQVAEGRGHAARPETAVGAGTHAHPLPLRFGDCVAAR